MRLLRIIVVLSVIVPYLGCGSLSPPPKDKFYRLTLESPGATQDFGAADDIIYIPPFKASGLHSERALIFAHNDGASLEQHVYHFWIDSPRTMLQYALADHLRAASRARIVIDPVVNAEFTVRGRVRRFERSNGGGAQVALNLALYGEHNPVAEFEHDYERSMAVRDSSIAASVAALSEGTAEIFVAFTGDLRRHLAQ